ncbi:Uncharacterized membrane protein [Daejeonella rubra]|uniref:Uncharacterized membrane protein n=1 Tax=Daejeonella rubra TaxID=990371 RepID=A0A1G9RZP0_9SPHI|nr:DUF2231 domain-containing protein [Daejeonella rubra]SDM28470.1 Uncharacterized membrane protein [Daejeonella rubra]
MVLLDIAAFSGQLHPLIVHLPIGFLILALLFELLSYFKKYEFLKSSVSITLLLGFVAAVLACIFGYILSLSGDYDYRELNNHKISGIALALGTGLLFLLVSDPVKKLFEIKRSVFSVLCIFIVALVSYTGHQGGRLTHGSEYLSLKVLLETPREKPVSVGQAMIFEDVVHPILIQRCSQCHRDGKRKGEFSVQTLEDLLKGGKTGPAIEAGALNKSELFARIMLDPTNEKFMPSDGKTPLTKTEIEIIQWWIEKGKAVDGKRMSELQNTQVINAKVASYLKLGNFSGSDELAGETNDAVNQDIPAFVKMALIDTLRSKGLNIRVMQHKPLMLDVTLSEGKGDLINSMKTNLKSIAKNIIWLNLSNNELTDQDLDFLALMSNLEKLRLEKNPITDKIIPKVLSLKYLESINLNETKLTSAGIERLKQNSSVKRVYQWNLVSK